MANVGNKVARLVGYVRVSTVEQAAEGVSLAAQRAKLESYAAAMGLQLVAVVEDAGRSAKDMNRPGLQQVLQMLDGGEADGVLICKLDRLTRSVRDLAELMDRYFGDGGKRSLVSVGDSIDTRTPTGRMVLNMIGVVAQWERETTVERVREAAAHLKRTGHRYNLGRAIGYSYGEEVDANGRRVVVQQDTEAEACRIMAELRKNGATLREICAELERRGIPTKRGGTWSPKVVRSVLLRIAA